MQARTLTAVLFTLCLAAPAQSAPKSTVSPDQIPVESLSVYRTFLNGYHNGTNSVLNVAQTTNAFAADDGDLAGCMKAFARANSSTNTIHRFRDGDLPVNEVRFVDPATHQRRDPGNAIRRGDSVEDALRDGFAAALFTFSEVVFDSSRAHAAFNYSFVCGDLCGHGGTVVFDKQKNGQWKESKKSCGSWIS